MITELGGNTMATKSFSKNIVIKNNAECRAFVEALEAADITDSLNDLFVQHLDVTDILTANALAKISAAITKERVALGMNKSDFANHLGVSQSMIAKWESGDYNFTINTISKIFDKLGLAFDICIENRNCFRLGCPMILRPQSRSRRRIPTRFTAMRMSLAALVGISVLASDFPGGIVYWTTARSRLPRSHQ